MSTRYNSFNDFARQRFGGRVRKLAIDAGFSCPNRDGSIGTGGCTYCLNEAFNPSYCSRQKDVLQQIDEAILFHQRRRHSASNYVAYLQAYSNTHAPLEQLQSMYLKVLAHPAVAGLVIGTRPDCIDEQKLDFLAELSLTHFVMVEYGVESIYDRSLEHIRRGHDYACAQNAIALTAERNIYCGAHFILGLPDETYHDYIQGVDSINKLKINTIKFHQLQIIRNTAMEAEYRSRPEAFAFFDFDSYASLMADIVERLRPDLIIERFAAEVPPRYLAAKPWNGQRHETLQAAVSQLLAKRQSYQGKLFHP